MKNGRALTVVKRLQKDDDGNNRSILQQRHTVSHCFNKVYAPGCLYCVTWHTAGVQETLAEYEIVHILVQHQQVFCNRS